VTFCDFFRRILGDVEKNKVCFCVNNHVQYNIYGRDYCQKNTSFFLTSPKIRLKNYKLSPKTWVSYSAFMQIRGCFFKISPPRHPGWYPRSHRCTRRGRYQGRGCQVYPAKAAWTFRVSPETLTPCATNRASVACTPSSSHSTSPCSLQWFFVDH